MNPESLLVNFLRALVAYPYVILMNISAVLAAALIAWYVRKWPKQKE
jgi:hypothetical protein